MRKLVFKLQNPKFSPVALKFCSSSWCLSKSFACGAHNSDFVLNLLVLKIFAYGTGFLTKTLATAAGSTATNFNEIYLVDGPFLYLKDQENQEIERLSDQENQEIGEKMTRKPGKILKI